MITDRMATTTTTGAFHAMLHASSTSHTKVSTSPYMFHPSHKGGHHGPPGGRHSLQYSHPPHAAATVVSAPSPSGSDTMNAAAALSVLQDAVYVAEKGGSIHRGVMTSSGSNNNMAALVKPPPEEESRKRTVEHREAEDELGDGGGTTEEDEVPAAVSPDIDFVLANGLREGRWTTQEHDLFLEGYRQFGKSWKDIATVVPTRTPEQIRTHAQKFFGKTRSMSESSTSSSTSMTDQSNSTNKRIKLDMSQQPRSNGPTSSSSLQSQQQCWPRTEMVGMQQHPSPTGSELPAGAGPADGYPTAAMEGSANGSVDEDQSTKSMSRGDGALSILIQELENNDPGGGDSEDDTDDDEGDEEEEGAGNNGYMRSKRNKPSSGARSGGNQTEEMSESEDENDGSLVQGEDDDDDDEGGAANKPQHRAALVPSNRVPVTMGANGNHQLHQVTTEKVVSREGRWSKEEHQLFLEGHRRFGKVWKEIATLVKTRTPEQIRTHHQKWQQREAKRLTHAVRAVDSEQTRRQSKSGKQGGEVPARQSVNDVAPLRSKRQRKLHPAVERMLVASNGGTTLKGAVMDEGDVDEAMVPRAAAMESISL